MRLPGNLNQRDRSQKRMSGNGDMLGNKGAPAVSEKK